MSSTLSLLCLLLAASLIAPGNCQVNCQVNESAVVFAVGRTRVLYEDADPLPFDELFIDTTGGFDSNTAVYTVRQSGYYLTHFSAGVLPYTPVILELNSTTNAPNVLMTYNGHNGEMMVSRDDIQFWSKGQEIWLSSYGSLNGDSYYPTSWSAVRLDNIMAPTVAFTLARTTDYTTSSGSYLPFTDIMVTIGNSMKTCQNIFVAPTSGIYFLSYSVGVQDKYSSSSYIYMHLQVDGNTIGSLWISGIAHYNEDISSNSLITTLNTGDNVQLYHYSFDPYFHFTDSHYQTALTGFLYQPQHGRTIAWHVSYNADTTFTGPITAFPFNFAFVNVGGAWQSAQSAVIVPVKGIYWLKISGMSSQTLSTQFNMILSVNGQSIISVVEKITTNSQNTRQHAIAYHLNAGDRLVVSIPTGFTLYTWDYSATFTGFLIYPD